MAEPGFDASMKVLQFLCLSIIGEETEAWRGSVTCPSGPGCQVHRLMTLRVSSFPFQTFTSPEILMFSVMSHFYTKSFILII